MRMDLASERWVRGVQWGPRSEGATSRYTPRILLSLLGDVTADCRALPFREISCEHGSHRTRA